MTNNEINDKVLAFVEKHMTNTDPGHDIWHVKRVWHTARLIGKNHNVNTLLVDLGALLHDVADAKFHNGDEEIGPQMVKKFLDNLPINPEIKDKTIQIIKHISFKNKEDIQPEFIEFKIVQDADRLDAMGAIGIARAFSFGGFRNKEMYNPHIKPNNDFNKEVYKKHEAPTINHFYDKLLTLKYLMNTEEGKKMAEERHAFIQVYLDEFFKEWKT